MLDDEHSKREKADTYTFRRPAVPCCIGVISGIKSADASTMRRLAISTPTSSGKQQRSLLELLHYVEGGSNTWWPKASSVRKVAASIVRLPVVELK